MSTNPAEAEPNPNSGTAQGLIDFLTWVLDNDYMNAATASGLRTGVKKVLEAEPDLSALDIRHADVDDILLRFRNRNRGKMKDKSVEVYESRFKSSCDMYVKWLNGDKDWNPVASRSRRPSNGEKRVSKPQPSPVVAPREDDVTHVAAQPGLITYPFPIRSGLQGKITLPENLTQREAERISAFIKTLAFEDEVVYEPRREIASAAYEES
ncbi:hypothetical protein [Phycicoccus ginsengisoli]